MTTENLNNANPNPAPNTQDPAPKATDKTPAPKDNPVKEYLAKFEAISREKEELAKQLEEMKTKELESTNNFKQLYEQERRKREDAEKVAKTTRETYVKDYKFNVIREEALKAGIRPEALEDLERVDSSIVQIETTSTGRVGVIGAKEFVEDLKARRGFWFADTTPPNINNGRPNMNNSELSAQDILALEKTNPKEYNRIMQSKLRK